MKKWIQKEEYVLKIISFKNDRYVDSFRRERREDPVKKNQDVIVFDFKKCIYLFINQIKLQHIYNIKIPEEDPVKNDIFSQDVVISINEQHQILEEDPVKNKIFSQACCYLN